MLLCRRLACRVSYPVILLEFTSTVPVPLGPKTILPFVSVDEIVLPFVLILSTSNWVTPAIAVVVAPSVKVDEPKVIVGFAYHVCYCISITTTN